jgi:hypothetical protein
MLATYFFYYNFCRVHTTLRVIPCMEAGVTGYALGRVDNPQYYCNRGDVDYAACLALQGGEG